MARKSFRRALDEALRPYGFKKSGDDWIRVRGNIWECVNCQSSWLGGVTVNLYLKDLETEKLFLDIFGPEGAIQMPPPMSARIGMLIDGYDRWWTKDEVDGPSKMAGAVVEYGLPWFDPVHTLEEQAEHWFGRRSALSERGYDRGVLIGLALTLYRMGEAEEACEILCKPVPKTAIPENVRMVARVRDWMDCRPPVGKPSAPAG